MRQVWCLTLLSVLVGSGVASAQLPEVVYEWAGIPSTTQQWQMWGSHNQPLALPNFNTATMSAATGDLVVTETGTGGKVGKELWIFDTWGRPREDADPVNGKGGLDATGLEFIEVDIRHNHPSGTVYVDFLTQHWGAADTWYGGSDGTAVKQGAGPLPPAWPVAPGPNTIRFPISQLPTRNQAFIDVIWLATRAHEALGNLTWTVSQVRTAGTPLAYRDIVTNNVGSPDDGIDGAFPLNPTDMLAIVGNVGVANQEGLSRNPSGSGSLQWTDKGGTGAEGDESGATIGWGNGAGWRNAQPGVPTDGNSYNQRTSNFSGYDRMTVTISALDAVNPVGTVGIEPLFMVEPLSESALPTFLPSQNLLTDGQYHDLVYDLSSVTFLKKVHHWGLDVAAHANDIVFNIDNIRLWNSAAATQPGDHNLDGEVDAADYVAGRKLPGSFGGDPAWYDTWRENFGEPAPGSSNGAVPEPSATFLLLTAIVGLLWKRRGV